MIANITDPRAKSFPEAYRRKILASIVAIVRKQWKSVDVKIFRFPESFRCDLISNQVEEEERQKIKQVKDAETEAAMRDLEAWKNSNSTIQETINTSKAIIDLSDEAMKANGTEVTKPKSATEETKAAGMVLLPDFCYLLYCLHAFFYKQFQLQLSNRDFLDRGQI